MVNKKVKKSGFITKKVEAPKYQPLPSFDFKRKAQPQIETNMLITNTQYPASKEVAEARRALEQENAKKTQFVMTERKLGRAEQAQLVREQKKTESARRLIDNYLMGKGSYTKTLASAIKDPEDAKRVFAERDRRNQEAAERKRLAAQARINKMGGIKYVTAKGKHLKHVHKRKIRQWKKEDEFSPQVTYLVTKKKGKRGTSPIGNVLHKMMYPVHPKKRGRW